MGKIIVITSGKGGTGKSTTVGAVGASLARLGHSTLVIDADIGLRNLDIVLGVSDLAVNDFTDITEGRRTADEAVLHHPNIKNLYFLAAPASKRPEDIDAEGFAELLDGLRNDYEYILVDCPAGMGAGFRLATCRADSAIVVATGDASSLRDAQKVVTEIESIGIDDVRLLVNRVRHKLVRRSKSTVDDYIDSVGARLIGLVAEDKCVILAANLETPLVLYSRRGASAQFMRVAQRITGERVPLGTI